MIITEEVVMILLIHKDEVPVPPLSKFVIALNKIVPGVSVIFIQLSELIHIGEGMRSTD